MGKKKKKKVDASCYEYTVGHSAGMSQFRHDSFVEAKTNEDKFEIFAQVSSAVLKGTGIELYGIVNTPDKDLSEDEQEAMAMRSYQEILRVVFDLWRNGWLANDMDCEQILVIVRDGILAWYSRNVSKRLSKYERECIDYDLEAIVYIMETGSGSKGKKKAK